MTNDRGYLSYDGFASLYDQTRVIPPDSIHQIIDLCGRAAKMKGGGLFLDAGVGTGRFGVPLSAAYPGRVVGVDVSTEMMLRARARAGDELSLVQGDLRRLPFPNNIFNGALIVHILHLIERWEDVLDELRRVLVPGGVLLLGSEQGGRSMLIDYYLQQARARGISTQNLGAPGVTLPMAYLRQRTPLGTLPRAKWLSGSNVAWTRQVGVAETLSILEMRAFSQMRFISEQQHQELLEATRDYAIKMLGSVDAIESLDGRFVLYGIWHD